MATAKEKLSKLRDHNVAQYKGDRVGTLSKVEVQDAYQENLESFATEVIKTRQGKIVDKYNRNVPAYDVSLPEAVADYFGIVAPDRNHLGQLMTPRERDMFAIKKFFKQNDVHFGSDTLETAGQRFGHAGLNVDQVNQLLVSHSSFDATNNTTQIPADFRFLIPELIMAAIRLDYIGGSMHTNWISSTVNISQRKVTMPQIRRGNAVPRKIGEAESIPFGTVRFGEKEATVFKVGMGFKITDELIEASTLDMLFEFMGQVGTEMAICSDVEAARVLINGEQTNGIESAPVIGVKTPGDFAFYDLRRTISRLVRLKRNVNRILTSETDGVDISLLPEYRGFAGDKTLGNLNTILGVPNSLENDVFVLPANQIMLLAPDSAMMKLQYRGMKTENRRNPQNQENEMFVSDYVGFAIKRRDGRVLVDKTLDFGTYGFPAYMDVDARINQMYGTIND